MNTVSIQNKKKWSVEKTIQSIESMIKEKFNLDCSSKHFLSGSLIFVEIKIKGLAFPIFMNTHNEYSMPDVPSESLERFNSPDKPYISQAQENGKYYIDLSNSYAYLHEVIKHHLAVSHENNYIDSDGAGLIAVNSELERLQSFSHWMNNLEQMKGKKDIAYKAFSFFFAPSKEKVLSSEKTFFPELFKDQEEL